MDADWFACCLKERSCRPWSASIHECIHVDFNFSSLFPICVDDFKKKIRTCVLFTANININPCQQQCNPAVISLRWKQIIDVVSTAQDWWCHPYRQLRWKEFCVGCADQHWSGTRRSRWRAAQLRCCLLCGPDLLHCSAPLHRTPWLASSASSSEHRLMEQLLQTAAAPAHQFLQPPPAMATSTTCGFLICSACGCSPSHAPCICSQGDALLSAAPLRQEPGPRLLSWWKNLIMPVSDRVIGAGFSWRKICRWLGIQLVPAAFINVSQHNINYSVLFKILLMVEKQMI